LVAGAGLFAWVLMGKRIAKARRAGGGSFSALKNAIIGTSKEAVAGVFGPPRTAAMNSPAPAIASDRPQYWNADTWYYLLDRRNKLGVAIEFIEGRAAKVDHIENPRTTSRMRRR
jgi:hypothetical protein